MKWIPFDFAEMSVEDIRQHIAGSIVGVSFRNNYIQPAMVLEYTSLSVVFLLHESGLAYTAPHTTKLYRPVVVGKRWYLTDVEPILVNTLPARQWSRGWNHNSVSFRSVAGGGRTVDLPRVTTIAKATDVYTKMYEGIASRTDGDFLLHKGTVYLWETPIGQYINDIKNIELQPMYMTLRKDVDVFVEQIIAAKGNCNDAP